MSCYVFVDGLVVFFCGDKWLFIIVFGVVFVVFVVGVVFGVVIGFVCVGFFEFGLFVGYCFMSVYVILIFFYWLYFV